MCSILGFIGKGDERINLDAFRAMVLGNVCRGPHAFGFAWIDAKGALRHYKQPGNLANNLAMLNMMRGARVALCHVRYATHGDAGNNTNNHPFPVDGGWLIHNGVIGNHLEIERARKLHPVSECDSEVLALLVEKSSRYHIMERVTESVDACAPGGPLAAMMIWKTPHRLIAVRRGQPLSMGSTTEGCYIASLAAGLPGEIHPVKDNHAVRLQQSKGGELRAHVHAVTPISRRPVAPNGFGYTAGGYRGG